MDKKELRKHIRELKSHFSNDQLVALSRPIVERIESHCAVKSANTILMYYSLADEVCTHDLIDRLACSGKTVLLPHVIDSERMELRRYQGVESMSVGCYGILEPTGKVFTSYCDIDVAIVPGVSFDKSNNRLGRGRGYYDRFLSALPDVYKIGVCFDFQKFDTIPSDINDIKMDEVI